MYTPAQVRERVAPINKQIEELLDEKAQVVAKIEAQRSLLRGIQQRCPHKDRYVTSCMGDTGWRCPDCGDGG